LYIDYEPEPNLPIVIELYNMGSKILLLKDDGIFPDAVAKDYKYCVKVKADINKLINDINELEDGINSRGSLISYKGHDGFLQLSSEIDPFDMHGFKNSQKVRFNPTMLWHPDCSEIDIVKEKSLLITDINVVEDPVRTFNMSNTLCNAQNTSACSGNIIGAWSFGTLFKNMVDPNNNTNGQKIKNSLKEILLSFVQSSGNSSQPLPYTGLVAKSRKDIIHHLIWPWIKMANPNLTFTGLVQNSFDGWIPYFDNSNADDLLKFAPFKLTAIVNRLDLRGNSAYTTNLFNAGETRFIFTLLNLNDFTKTPKHVNITNLSFGSLQPSNYDWQGMNIIFEYGNPQTNLEDLITFAEQWKQLSNTNLVLGSAAYNSALQAITDIVTSPNAAPNKPIGSAINRIRTNEKIFDNGNSNPGGNFDFNWGLMDWGFRQFELDINGDFRMVPLTNTPFMNANDAICNGSNLSNGTVPFNNTNSVNLINWATTMPNKLRVINNNFNIPTILLENGSENPGELLFYYGLDKQTLQNNNLSESESKQIRHHISLNTCQGCHAGETKTNFTMVAPLPYGTAADYYGTTPNGIAEDMDGRFYPANTFNGPQQNLGYTFEQYLLPIQPSNAVSDNHNIATTVDIQPTQPFKQFFQFVSPFITGRRYSKDANNQFTWQDDNTDPDLLNLDNNTQPPSGQIPLHDQTSTGLFYVNDPDNQSYPGAQTENDGPYPGLHNNKFGYNDLDMRHKKLCQLLYAKSVFEFPGKTNVINLISQTAHIPFAIGAH
jgi:hypothetical protein